ncbi:MAG: hypothetical protein QOD52_448, partial [Gaiellaceae bacterium]|nr:hypothetical protein [Gaiellaceae bacterium]
TDAIGLERLEALLGGDEPRTAAEIRRAALLADLRGATLPTPGALRSRVLASRPAPRRSSFLSRRLAFAVVPAALAIAVTAALVHGLTTGSGGRPVSGSATFTAPAAVRKAPSAKRLASPHGSFSAGVAAGSGGSTAATPQATLAPTTTSGRLAHTDASLEVRVSDVAHLSAATSQATRIATSLAGYAQSVDYQTPKSGSGTASIVLRVPAQNVQRALARLASLGTLVSQEVSSQDLQHQLQVQSDQIAQLRRRVAALQQAIADPALPDAQRVLLQIKLAESKRALSQRLNARKGTISAGTTARISLVLGTERSVITPAPPRGRTGRMLHSAVGFLGLEATIALYALIVISPLAALGGLGWGLARARRRRDEQRLLAA